MPYGISVVDISPCLQIEATNLCDPKAPCNPFYQEGACAEPYICVDKIRHPAFDNEITRCMEGPSMNVKDCGKQEDPKTSPHICDPLPPCSEIRKLKLKNKPICIQPTLCYEKIKNPDPIRKPAEPCDPTK